MLLGELIQGGLKVQAFLFGGGHAISEVVILANKAGVFLLQLAQTLELLVEMNSFAMNVGMLLQARQGK